MQLRDFLNGLPIPFESFLHQPAPSSSRFAGNVHVSGHRVAKGVLVRAGAGYVLAVLPSTGRIDWEQLSTVLDGVRVSLAEEGEIEQVFGDCERGALPPFGRPYGIPTVVDTSLADGPEIVCVGNCRHEGVRLRYQDYESAVAPVRARFVARGVPA